METRANSPSWEKFPKFPGSWSLSLPAVFILVSCSGLTGLPRKELQWRLIGHSGTCNLSFSADLWAPSHTQARDAVEEPPDDDEVVTEVLGVEPT